ncbi:permease [Salmonella enterica subsp. enterica]|nr:permease [Salmonella enterica subsp. enterica]
MSFQPSFAGPQPDSRIDRTTFIRRAYLHLAVAIVGFIVLERGVEFYRGRGVCA